MTYLTRADEGLGDGLFDSVHWALETHCKQPDSMIYNYAVLHGDETAPAKIEFWKDEPQMLAPDFKEYTAPDYVWVDTR